MSSRAIMVVLAVAVIGLTAAAAAEQEGCINVWEPVCGVNGQTYSNHCFAEEAGVGVLYEGECLRCGTIAGLECPKSMVCDLEPGMCGVADAPGLCVPPPGEICKDDYRPVCGCDGKTYGNDCERLQAGAQKDYNGECVKGARG